jgi:hypothetical protein
MPYRPISKPQRFQSLNAERRDNDAVGTRTFGGTADKAKLAAKAFARGLGVNDQAPAWGPGTRSFSEQRQLNPNTFRTWGEQLATTNAGYEFQAPVQEPLQQTGGAASTADANSSALTSDKEVL